MPPRRRISYLFPPPNTHDGHCLGVNSIVVDQEREIMYSGGRDGLVCTWELNAPSTQQGVKIVPVIKSSQRIHSHWINDMVINPRVITASSDRTVKLWRLFGEERPPTGSNDDVHPLLRVSTPDLPFVRDIGCHGDFIKCLASPKSHLRWVASGGLDRSIRIWDIQETRRSPLTVISSDLYNASIYALGTDGGGGFIVSGSPEKAVRMWDIRTGGHVGVFLGHADMMLTASSDGTIRFWSVPERRCIKTFTYHTDSVWSLYSADPDLRVWWSGSRDGTVVKAWRDCGNPASRYTLSEQDGWELLLKDSDGVSGLCTMHSKHHGRSWVWTASSHPRIRLWKDSAKPSVADASGNITNKRSMYNGISTDGHHSGTFLRVQSLNAVPTDEDVSTSLPLNAAYESESIGSHGLPVGYHSSIFLYSIDLLTAGKCYKIRDFVEDWDQIVDLAETKILRVHLDEGSCFDAEVYADELELTKYELGAQGEFSEEWRGKWILHGLFRYYVEAVARESEASDKSQDVSSGSKRRQRRNGSNVHSHPPGETLAKSDHHRGLGHSSRRRTASSANDHRPSVGSSSYRPSLDDHRAVQVPKPALMADDLAKSPSSSAHYDPRAVAGVNSRSHSPPERASLMSAMTGKHSVTATNTALASPQNELSAVTPGSTASNARTPSSELPEYFRFADPPAKPQPAVVSPTIMGRLKTFSLPVKKLTRSMSNISDKKKVVPSSVSTVAPTPGGTPMMINTGMLGGSVQPTMQMQNKLEDVGLTVESSSLAGGSVGIRRVNLISDPTKETEVDCTEAEDVYSPVLTSTTSPIPISQRTSRSTTTATVHQDDTGSRPRSTPISPVSPIPRNTPHHGVIAPDVKDIPMLMLPHGVMVVISDDDIQEEAFLAKDAPICCTETLLASWEMIGKLHRNVDDAAPAWLTEFLLRNRIPVRDSVKLSFFVRPTPECGLPDLSNGSIRLTANRILRVRKILAYVAERLEPSKPSASDDATKTVLPTQKRKPEDWLELVCNEQLLDIRFTLASIRTFIWKSSTDIQFQYQPKGYKATQLVL